MKVKKITNWKQIQKLPIGTKVLIFRPPVLAEVAGPSWTDEQIIESNEYEVEREDYLKDDLERGFSFYALKEGKSK